MPMIKDFLDIKDVTVYFVYKPDVGNGIVTPSLDTQQRSFGWRGYETPIPPYIYYVDATNGNDLNDGLSESNAWQTISKVNSVSFNPRAQILFKRGEVWKEQLNLPSAGTLENPIIFGAYGEGEKPIITALENINEWSIHSGNIWKATVIIQPNVVFFDDELGIKNSLILDLTSEKDWYWESNTLYVYSLGNPNIVYTSPGIEAPARDHAIKNYNRVGAIYSPGMDYIVIENLHLIGGLSHAIGITYADNNEIKNCLIEKSGRMGVIISHSENNKVHDCIIQNNLDDAIWVTYSSHNAEIYNNLIEGNGRGLEKSDRNALGVWNSENLEIYNNIIIHDGYNAPVEIGAASTPEHISSVNFYNNSVDGKNVKHPVIDGIKRLRSTFFIYDGDYKIYNNIFIGGSEAAAIFIMDNQRTESDSVKIDFYNNTIYRGLVGIQAYDEYDVSDLTEVNIKNNIISNSIDYNIKVAKDIGSKVNIDYNLYDSDEGSKFWWDYRNRGSSDFSEWKTISGKDAHSAIGDPGFVDAANDNFHPTMDKAACDGSVVPQPGYVGALECL